MSQSWRLKADHSFKVAVAAAALTVAALVVGVWQFVSGKTLDAANWVMAAGGLGIIVFSAVQLHREARREEDRLAAARAKLKPAAWLARRMCDQAVIESDSKPMNQWLMRWYISPRTYAERGGIHPIDLLEERMRETVTLAAEVGSGDVCAADAAFSAFITAANIINDLNAKGITGALDSNVAIPAGRKAASHLFAAADALKALAPRGTDEPVVPANPKFYG
jgi:hypothetical protein